MATYENLGIDFGTCSIKISNCTKNFEVDAVRFDKNDHNDDRNVPNVIRYDDFDKYIIGSKAKKAKANTEQSKNVVDFIKRKIELEEWHKSFVFDEKSFTLNAEEIASDIFSSIYSTLNNNGVNVKNTVVTVPVCFTEVQKQRIIRAAKKAGFSVIDSITEPVAALFAFEEDFFDEACEENVIVFDFGGATLDLCLANIRNDGEGSIRVEVDSTVGWRFGGVDITKLIAEQILCNKYKEIVADEIKASSEKIVMGNLFELADELKAKLFESDDNDEASTYYANAIVHRLAELSVTKEEIIQVFNNFGMVDKLNAVLDDLFYDSKISKDEVTKLKVIGGTSRICFFREFLQNYFGQDVYDMEYDEFDPSITYRAVANGASRYAKLVADADNNIKLINSIAYYIGIAQGNSFKKVINRQQKYGKFTPRKLLKRKEIENMNWQLKLYQAFVEDDVSITGENGAVYLGSVNIDESLYENEDFIYYRLGINNQGLAICETYILQDDYVLVETIPLHIGG